MHSETNRLMTTNISSSSYSFSNTNARNFENQAISESVLKWSSLGQGRQEFVVSSQSDFNTLRNLKNVLLTLQNEFTQGGSKIVFTGDKKDDFNKRLILLESQIEGLMKRRIDFTSRSGDGSRALDYTGILNEKENQIVELEKKINNLEERLRKATARQFQLENEVSRLFQQIKLKDKIIQSKNEIILGEVSISNLLKETLQKSSIALPSIANLEIRADLLNAQGANSRTSAYQQLPGNKKNKTQLIQLFRQFEKINSSEGITIEEVDKTLESFILSLEGSKFRQTVDIRLRRRRVEEEYERLQNQFGAAVGIFQAQLQKIKLQNPNIKIETDSQIFQMLRQHKINVYKTSGDVIQLERFSERTIEVPVQDARTKHLLHLFAVQMKKFTAKYPKLQAEMDGRLTEFFQQQLIDIIEVDEIDRLVEIVKYVPQVVKVENVYAYSSEKSRKVEFHLRVLVKALLEQLEKIRAKTGVVLEMDQGVVGMINRQIMGVVDVDDILKVFRVVPKLVQVEKIVEKIVERIVEVPQIVVVEKIIEKIVEVQKIKQVQRIVNVPLQVPIVITNVVQKIVQVQKIIQRIVEVPQIIERIIEITKQVPKIIEVEKYIDRIVETERIVQVERIVPYIQHEIRQVQVIKEIIVPSQEKIVERIVQVPVIVEKIVEKIVQVPQIIEVERIVQLAVPVNNPQIAKEIENHIEVRHEIVERIIEKPIPIIQIVEKIVEVPQIIEKLVETKVIIRQPYEVEVIREKLVFQDRIKEVEVIRDRIVIQNRQVIKEVERIVQIPIIQQKIVRVTEIVEKPIIQRSENTIIKEVYLRDPQIIRQPKIVQVEKIINNYIEVPKPVKYIEQKIVEVIRHVDRIREIKVPVEKIIEKMVEVPKVVQVQKIVEKIVVVPRVVEKIVEVPQIIERIVPKIIIEERIKEVQRIIEKPVFQERPVEIQVIRNVYIEVQKVVDRIVDKLVQVPRYEQRVINNQVIIEKIIEVIKQVPRNLQVEKIIYNQVEVAKPVEIERQIIVPVEVPIPVEKIIEKIVPATEVIEKIVPVTQVFEKIVAQRVEQVKIHEIVRTEQKIVVDQVVKEVIKEVPYIQERIKQVIVQRQKIVPIQSVVQEIVTAQQIIEKVVEKSITVPKIHEVQRTREIVVQVPKIIQVEKIIPQLVNVNRYIERIVEKIVEVPVIIEQIKQIVRENQKIVEIKTEYETIKQVERVIQKAVIMQKFKQVVRNINHIEKILQIVDRYEQTPVQIIAHQERLVEVPYILEKIVEKIVIMPQIVQVLKYVHEVFEEETLGVAVGVDVATHEQKYKLLTKDLKGNIGLLLAEMKKIRLSNPALSIQIQIIERFLSELEQFILFPRIVQVSKQKIVQRIIQKDNIVKIPSQDQRSIKMQLTLSLLVEKLILQLKRVKQANPSVNFSLEDDIKLIFFTELESNTRSVGDDFNLKLKQFSDSIYRKFQSLGHWSFDHQMMLNTFLQERFMMANLVKNSNLEIQKSKNIQIKRQEALKQAQSQISVLEGVLNKFRAVKMQGISVQTESIFRNILSQFDQYKRTGVIQEPIAELLDLKVTDQRIQSLIRQKDAEIIRLKDRVFAIEKSRTIGTTNESQNQIVRILQSENLKLKNENNQLRTEKGSSELIHGFKIQITELNQRILVLEQEKSDLSSELSNLRREFEVKLQFKSSIKDSVFTGKSDITSPDHLISPVSKYQLGSPQQADYGIRMVDSKIQQNRGLTMTDSRQSQSTSILRQQAGFTTTASNVKGGIIQESRSSTYTGNYQPSTAQYGTNSGLYSSINSSQMKEGVSYTGQYGQAGSSSIYQSSTYTPGNPYQASTLQGAGSGLQSSGLQSSGLQSSGLQSSGLQSSGLQSSGLQSSGLQSSGLQSSGIQSLGIQQSSLGLQSSSGLQSSNTSYQSSFKSDTGYMYQGQSSTQQGNTTTNGSNFSSKYTYKKQ